MIDKNFLGPLNEHYGHQTLVVSLSNCHRLSVLSTDKARQGKARQGKARQGKARQGKARQGKARQGKAHYDKERKVN